MAELKPNERLFLQRALEAARVPQIAVITRQRIEKMLRCPEMFQPEALAEAVRRCLRYTNALQRALQLEEES